MTTLRVPAAALAVAIVYLVANRVTAQNPKPPTPLPIEIQNEGQLPLTDAVVFWIDGNDLTVYIDSTSNPEDQNKLKILEILWVGPGPGFDCDNDSGSDFHVCRDDGKIWKLPPTHRAIGPVYEIGNVIPNGYLETWSPETSWIVDGQYLTGDWSDPRYTLDKFDPNSPYFGPIPEPSSLMLLAIGLLFLRRRH